MPAPARQSVAPRSLAHLIAEIRAQLDLVGLKAYREDLRLLGARERLVVIQHAVEGARHAIEFHFACCPSGRDSDVRRELVMNFRALHENLTEARNRVGG